ncbi:MAG: heme exporter protein CcmD [Lautropia mirabilis]
MTHWHYVLIAYGLSALALVLELVLLAGRRRHARHCMEDARS